MNLLFIINLHLWLRWPLNVFNTSQYSHVSNIGARSNKRASQDDKTHSTTMLSTAISLSFLLLVCYLYRLLYHYMDTNLVYGYQSCLLIPFKGVMYNTEAIYCIVDNFWGYKIFEVATHNRFCKLYFESWLSLYLYTMYNNFEV